MNCNLRTVPPVLRGKVIKKFLMVVFNGNKLNVEHYTIFRRKTGIIQIGKYISEGPFVLKIHFFKLM
jgi:hypothetical protein